MFAVEMWFGVGDGVECGRSTGLYPLPLGVPRCVIHNKKMLERNFGNFEKKNNINHQNHSNNAKKQNKLSNDKTSTSGFVHNKPKEPSLWFAAIILLILRSFQRKGLCNSGLKAKSTTFAYNNK